VKVKCNALVVVRLLHPEYDIIVILLLQASLLILEELIARWWSILRMSPSSMISLLTLWQAMVVVVSHVSYTSKVLGLIKLVMLRWWLNLRGIVVVVLRLIVCVLVPEIWLEMIHVIIILSNSRFCARLKHLMD
jgi:hypothetical protein